MKMLKFLLHAGASKMENGILGVEHSALKHNISRKTLSASVEDC